MFSACPGPEIWTIMNTLKWELKFWIKIYFIQENWFVNIVCKIPAAQFRLQYVNLLPVELTPSKKNSYDKVQLDAIHPRPDNNVCIMYHDDQEMQGALATVSSVSSVYMYIP